MTAGPSEARRDGRRRAWVLLGTLVLGSLLLGLSLSAPVGGRMFYLWSAALAACWAIGALASAQRAQPPRTGGWATPLGAQAVLALAIGLGCVTVFVAGAFLITPIPFFRHSIEEVVGRPDGSSLAGIAVVTAVTGISEELFFRGALFGALTGRRPVLSSTVVYTLVTTASGSLMLVFAAAVLGTVTAFVRRETGGLLAPVITHLTWSLSMLLILPSIVSLH